MDRKFPLHVFRLELKLRPSTLNVVFVALIFFLGCTTARTPPHGSLQEVGSDVIPAGAVETPAAACDDLLGATCPRDVVDPHSCLSLHETSEKPDGKFRTLDVTECHSRRRLAAEICKAGLIPEAVNIRCQQHKGEKRTIHCTDVVKTMCAASFAPATCIGSLERPKLPPVHFVAEGPNLCATDVDLQKKICALASAESKSGQRNLVVSGWAVSCAQTSGSGNH